MEYIIHFFGQLVLAFVLANLVLLLVPRSIRKMFQATFKSTLYLLRFVINLAKSLVKTMCANAKEIESKTKKQPSMSNNKGTSENGKVIQFPDVENK